MKSARSLKAVRILVLALLATGLSAGLASAQQYVGKITLPVKTHWGNAVLPAGEYSFVLDPATPDAVTIRQAGKRLALIPTTCGIAQDTAISSSELVGVRKGGVLRVRTLRLAEVHLALFYPQAKGESQLLARNNPELVQRIAITMSGK
jgi:hypothetical protein